MPDLGSKVAGLRLNFFIQDLKVRSTVEARPTDSPDFFIWLIARLDQLI